MKSRFHACLRCSGIVLGFVLESSFAAADDCPAPFAPCFATSPGVNSGSPPAPSRTVVVTVKSVKTSGKVNCDVVWVHNPANCFGTVTIDGNVFQIPLISSDDFPHWEANEGSPRSAVFRQKIAGPSNIVPIKIRIDSHGGGVFCPSDKNIDINPDPAPGAVELELLFDMCALRISGNGNPFVPLQGVQKDIVVSGGTNDYEGTIAFSVHTEDNRPATADDLAIVDFDLIQVTSHPKKLAAMKPTLAVAYVANNFSHKVNTVLQVTLVAPGPGFPRTDVCPISLEAGEVQRVELCGTNPVLFPEASGAYNVQIFATVDPAGEFRKAGDDCTNNNDSYADQSSYKVVPMRKEFNLLWARVGSLIDVGNFVEPARFDDIHRLGTAYIKATYPLASLISDKCKLDIVPPLSGGAISFMSTILSAVGLPVDLVEPFVFVFELSNIAVLTGRDRIMGVVPTNWFDRYSYGAWKSTVGLSLAEFAPRAVIFESADATTRLPRITAPAHELGHTFGLSTDPSLKDVFLCSFGPLFCGATGGYDEYKASDKPACYKRGNPARGHWVPQGGEPTELNGIAGTAQCNMHCFMGASPPIDLKHWARDGLWIDDQDYEHLVEKLKTIPDPEVVYVSGIISHDDQVYLGPWYHLMEGIPDRTESDPEHELYAFVFIDDFGGVVQTITMPINENGHDSEPAPPIQFFGLTLPFPPQTRRIQLWNNMRQRMLAERTISAHRPEAELVSPQPGQPFPQGAPVPVQIDAADLDRDPLTYSVLIGPDGQSWWPWAYRREVSTFDLSTATLPPGPYFVKAVVSDGVHVGESLPRPIVILPGLGGQVPGDCNQDGTLDLSDAICIFGALFLGEPSRFPCGSGRPDDAGAIALLDWQPDGEIDLSDGISLLQFLFSSGRPHPLADPANPTSGCVPIPGCAVNPSCR